MMCEHNTFILYTEPSTLLVLRYYSPPETELFSLFQEWVQHCLGGVLLSFSGVIYLSPVSFLLQFSSAALADYLPSTHQRSDGVLGTLQ